MVRKQNVTPSKSTRGVKMRRYACFIGTLLNEINWIKMTCVNLWVIMLLSLELNIVITYYSIIRWMIYALRVSPHNICYNNRESIVTQSFRPFIWMRKKVEILLLKTISSLHNVFFLFFFLWWMLQKRSRLENVSLRTKQYRIFLFPSTFYVFLILPGT